MPPPPAKNLFIVLAVILAGVFAIFSANLPDPIYTPDSWSYYELSQTVGPAIANWDASLFYAETTVRQFSLPDIGYSSSFPPLWPVMLAAFDSLTGIGWRSGLVLNFLVLLGLLWALIGFCQRHLGDRRLGLVAFLAVCSAVWLWDEALGGRSIPLSALFLVGIMHLWLERLTPARAAALGVLAGLGTLNRFDFLPIAVVLGLLLLFWPHKKDAPAKANDAPAKAGAHWWQWGRPRQNSSLLSQGNKMNVQGNKMNVQGNKMNAPAKAGAHWWQWGRPRQNGSLLSQGRIFGIYAAALLLTLSPWIAYSWHYFNVPLISDNAPVVASVKNIHVADYLPDALPTMTDNLSAWIRAKLDNLSALAVRAGAILFFALIPLLAIWLLAIWKGRNRHGRTLTLKTLADLGPEPAAGTFRRLLPLGLALLAQFLAISLTGYPDVRYYLPLTVFVLLLVLIPVSAPLRRLSPNRWPWLLALAVALGSMLQFPFPRLSVAGPAITFIPVAALLGLGLSLWPKRRRLAWIPLAGVLLALAWPLAVSRLFPLPPTTFEFAYEAAASPLAPIPYNMITDCLAQSSVQPTRLLVMDPALADPFRFGALTGQPTVFRPHNLDGPELFRRFVAEYRPTHVLAGTRDSLNVAGLQPAEKSCGLPIYSLN